MDIIKFGNRANISDIKVIDNVVIVGEHSKIDSFINIGDDAEVKGLDAVGNEVHTPESYAMKVKGARDKIFLDLRNSRAIEAIYNDQARQKINLLLQQAAQQDFTVSGESRFKEIMLGAGRFAKEVGVAAVAAIISNHIK